MDEHDLIVLVKRLAEELDRVPSAEDFRRAVKGGRRAIEHSAFKTHSALLEAAGLVQAKMKIDNSIFQTEIKDHLHNYAPKPIVPSTSHPRILVLGDTHFPFIHPKGLEKAHLLSKELRPEYIIQMGDLYDMYSQSKFPRSHNVFTPKDEERTARDMAEKMWSQFRKDNPKARLIQLMGNHDARPLKRTLEVMPTMEHWIEKYLKDVMTFEGVETVFGTREEFKLGDITFVHGYLSGIGKHRDHFQGNVVCGHTHSAGVSYRQLDGRVIFELNVGFLGDQYSKGLSYTPTKTVPWTLGTGWIDHLGPRFIPY